MVLQVSELKWSTKKWKIKECYGNCVACRVEKLQNTGCLLLNFAAGKNYLETL